MSIVLYLLDLLLPILYFLTLYTEQHLYHPHFLLLILKFVNYSKLIEFFNLKNQV